MSIACPVCLERRDPRDRLLACSSCAPRRDDPVSAIMGRPTEVPPHGSAAPPRQQNGFTVAPEPANCPQCRREMRVEICRRCKQPYPNGWTSLDGTTSIVLAGARYAGKTVYIDVVSACLSNLPGLLRDHRVDALVEPHDEATALEDQRSRERMWEDGRAAESTRSIRDRTAPPPTRQYRLVRRDGDSQRTHVLLLRDIAGEDLTRIDQTPNPYFSFIGRADMLVFLVDPVQIKGVRDRLENRVAISATDMGADPLTILRNVTRLQGGRAPEATAIVLAKFDTLHSLAETADQKLSRTMQSPGFAYKRDPGALYPAYVAEDGALLDAEIRSLLEVLGAGEFLNKVRMHTRNPHFFAVSALGHQPLGMNLAKSGITAFRVLDPIKWALAPSRMLEPAPVAAAAAAGAGTAAANGPTPRRRWRT